MGVGYVGRATDEDFAAIFAALPTAYLVMSPELTIVDANPAYLQLLGRTRAELIGRYVFDAFPPSPETLDADGVRLPAAIRTALEDVSAPPFSYPERRTEG